MVAGKVRLLNSEECKAASCKLSQPANAAAAASVTSRPTTQNLSDIGDYEVDYDENSQYKSQEHPNEAHAQEKECEGYNLKNDELCSYSYHGAGNSQIS